jgi:hypothetical protein
MIRRVSSAYCTIGKSKEYPTLIGSLMSPLSFALLMMHYIRSAARTNSNRDSGSPGMMPLLQWKTFSGVSFSKTEEVSVDKIPLTHSIHLLRNHFCLIICRITLCSTLSNAFSKSSLRMSLSFFLSCDRGVDIQKTMLGNPVYPYS